MQILSTLFWHPTQSRLRALWRLAIQFILMAFLLAAFQAAALILGEILAASLPVPSLPSASAWIAPLQGLILLLSSGLAVAASVYLAARFLDRRRIADLGFNLTQSWWADLGTGLGLGVILMTLIFLVELSLGWIQVAGLFSSPQGYPSFLGELASSLLIYLMVGFYEEFYSRGYLIKNLSEGLTGKLLPPRLAIILACALTSIYFGALHAANPNATALGVLNISLAGVLLAAGYLVTGQLGLSIGLHISWNFFQGAVFGFPVSGSADLTGSIIQINQLGPSLWTGGIFGPEGGLLGTLVITLGIGIILALKGSKQGIDPGLSRYLPAGPNSEPRPSSPLTAQVRGQPIKHIIWDWNGTLLDDLDLCLEIINGMLAARDLPGITRETYLQTFDFPVMGYYQQLGFDFREEPFESLSDEFIQAYEKGRPDCELMAGARDILQHAASRGISQSILSASKESYLLKALGEYGVEGFFSSVQGLEDHHAAGKLDLAQAFLERCGLDPGQLLLVGDTAHDGGIAAELGLNCILIPNGHHSRQRLEEVNFPLVSSLDGLKSILK